MLDEKIEDFKKAENYFGKIQDLIIREENLYNIKPYVILIHLHIFRSMRNYLIEKNKDNHGRCITESAFYNYDYLVILGVLIKPINNDIIADEITPVYDPKKLFHKGYEKIAFPETGVSA